MDLLESFETQLYSINDGNFENIALSLFRYQAKENGVYRRYLDFLGVKPGSVETVADIPFFPISFFKRHHICTGSWAPAITFTSSGTGGGVRSNHPVRDLDFYWRRARRCFEHFFGPLSQYHVLALLPSYHEQPQSSLLSMIRHFMEASGSSEGGFYLNDYDKLVTDVQRLRKGPRKVILWGVTYALLDLAERYRPDFGGCLVFETGGMKGRRREITRAELHAQLIESLNVGKVYAEYGMTELLSQAYTRGGEGFFCPPGFRVLVREPADPFSLQSGGVGGLNVVDLANFNTIAFIETEDLGSLNVDGSFSVVGRMDNADIRGCNLLVN